MGFLDSLTCVFTGCASAQATQVLRVVNSFNAKVNVSCAANAYTSALTACSVVSDHCSNMTLVCESTANINASCDVASMVKAAVDALLQEFSPAVVSQVLSLPPENSGYVDITNAFTAQVQDNCISSASVSSTITQSIVCADSSNATINVLSNMDLKTACMGSAIAGIARASASSAAPPTSGNRQVAIFVAVVAALGVYGFILLLLIKEIRATGSRL